MATLEQRPKLEVEVVMRLSEAEVRALEALAGYGTDGFLEVFYKHMGKHYLQPHESGLRSLFEGVKEHLPPIMARTNDARRAFAHGLKPQIRAA